MPRIEFFTPQSYKNYHDEKNIKPESKEKYRV